MQINSDIDLAKRIVCGDLDAENILFSQFDEKIFFIVRYRLKGRVPLEEQEDVVSEIKLAILNSLRKNKYDTSKNIPLGTYIFGIAHNKIALYFRNRGKRENEIQQETLPEYADSSANALDTLISTERKDRLKRKLNKLKPAHKEILLLRVYEKLSIEEISKILNIDRKKVIDRIHYAFKRFIQECKKDKYFSMFDIILQIYI